MSFELSDPSFNLSEELKGCFENAKKYFLDGNIPASIIQYKKIIQNYETVANSWKEKTIIYYDFSQLLKLVGEEYECAIRLQQSAHALEMNPERSNVSSTTVESAKRYILAGDQFLKIRDDKSAVHCFLKAGLEFESLSPRLNISLWEFYGSVHGASTSSFFSSMCFEKAAELNDKMNQYEDSVGNYFRASQIAMKGGLNYDSFLYLKNAILGYVKRMGTITDLHKSCPVLEKRTKNAENVLKILRKRLDKSWFKFYKDNQHLGLKWVANKTLKDISNFYNTLANELSKYGNQEEADSYHVKFMDSQRCLLWNERKYLRYLFYWLLKIVSRYGTSLSHWLIVLCSVISVFAGLFQILSKVFFISLQHHPIILSSAAFLSVVSVSEVQNIYKGFVILESGIGYVMLAFLIHILFKKTYLRL